MRNVTLTPQQRKEIHDLYTDSSVKVKEIAKAYCIDPSTVCRIATSDGAEKRNPKIAEHRNTYSKAGTAVKKCGMCKKAVNVVGAKYCPYCGNDIRSTKELLTHRINVFAPKIKYLPESCRDELQNLFIDLKAELAKE